MEQFNQRFLNTCINFHRPCHFPTIETDHKGKQQKRYYQKDMMTPFDKLKSLPDAQRYLKPGISFDMLEELATKQSNLDAWKQLQKARSKLFNTIFGQTPKVA